MTPLKEEQETILTAGNGSNTIDAGAGNDLVIGLHVDSVEFENLEDKVTIKNYFIKNRVA